MLIVLLFVAVVNSQFSSYFELRLRLPGRCAAGDFDCGLGRCIPVSRFHDGRPDCQDGSDEWCFFGQLRCGAYCVGLQHGLSCMYPKCDGSNRQPQWCEQSKEKLCRRKQAFPCKGYGECVLWESLLDGQNDCIDGSDEDSEYVQTLDGPLRCLYNRTNHPQPNLISSLRPSSQPSPYVPLSEPSPPNSPYDLPPYFSRPSTVSHFLNTPYPHPTLVSPQEPPELSSPKNPFLSLSTSDAFQSYTPTYPPASSTGTQYEVLPTEPGTVIRVVNNAIIPVESTRKYVFPNILPAPPSDESAGFINVDQFFPEPTFSPPEPTASGYPASYIRPVTPISFLVPTNRPPTLLPIVPETDSGVKFGRPTIPPGAFFPEPITDSPTEGFFPEKIPPDTEGEFFPDGMTGGEHLIPLIPGPIRSTPAAPDSHIHFVTHPTTQGGPRKPNREKPEKTTTIPSDQGQSTIRISVITVPDDSVIATSSSMEKEQLSSISTTPSAMSSKESPNNSGEHLEGGLHIMPTHAASKPTSTTSNSNSADEHQMSSSTSSDGKPTSSTTPKISTENSCLETYRNYLSEKYPNPRCNCAVNEFQIDGECKVLSDLTPLEYNVSSACGEENLSFEDRARIAVSAMSENTRYESCVLESSDGRIVLNVRCSQCDIHDFDHLTKHNATAVLKTKVHSLGALICEDQQLNPCSADATCSVGAKSLRAECRCVEGTQDLSNSTGRICEGIGEIKCLKLFGICIIFWLFLLCLLALLPLCFFCTQLWFLPYLKSRNVVHPTTPPPRKTSHNVRDTKQFSHPSIHALLEESIKRSRAGAKAMATARIEPPQHTILPVPVITPSTPSLSKPKSTVIEPKINANSNATAVETSPPNATTAEKGSETPILSEGSPKLQRVFQAPGSELIESKSAEEIKESEVNPLRATESAPTLPNPPAPLPVPQTSEEPVVNEAPPIAPSRSASQPTIWEKFKVLGTQDELDRQSSSSSLDDLIQKKFDIGETAATTSKPPSRPPSRPATANQASIQSLAVPVDAEGLMQVLSDSSEPIPSTNTLDDKEAPNPDNRDTKLAKMLGVEMDEMNDKNDELALKDMAESRVDLPLHRESETPIPEQPETSQSDHPGIENSAEPPNHQEQQATTSSSSAKPRTVTEKRSEEIIEIVSDTGKKSGSAESLTATSGERRKSKLIPPQPVRKRKVKPVADSASDSDPEVALFKKLEKLRHSSNRTPNPFKDRRRRFRRPERQLSCISEKSFELPSEPEQETNRDFTMTVPNTTRSLSDWHAHVPRRKFTDSRSQGIEDFEELSDVDIPSNKAPARSSEELPEIRGSKRSSAVSVTEASRVARSSLITRKIASRRIESRRARSNLALPSIGLMPENQRLSRSEELLASKSDDQKLPIIHPIQRVPHRRSSSYHSIRSARSGSSSVELSPYFNVSDMSKPPKEQLWWEPPMR